MSMIQKYKSLMSGQAVKDMKLVFDKAKQKDKLLNEITGYKIKQEMGNFYADKKRLVDNGASKRKMGKILNGRLNNIKNLSGMQIESRNNLDKIRNDVSKMKFKQNATRVGTAGVLGGTIYGGKKLYDNREVTAFEIVENSYESMQK